MEELKIKKKRTQKINQVDPYQLVKPMTWVIWLRWLHIKQIKNNYEAQLENIQLKKDKKGP